jgi:hypothetical protein
MPLIDANGGNDRGSPVTVYRAMAGVPVGAPTRPPVLFMRGKAAPHAAGYMSTSLMGFMRVRRHSHRHA